MQRVVVAGAVVVLLAGCGSNGETHDDDPEELGERNAPISSATLVDAQTLELWFATCMATLTPTVAETDDAVTVEVVARGGSQVADCVDTLEVELDDPLGDRELLDGTIDAPLDVEVDAG